MIKVLHKTLTEKKSLLLTQGPTQGPKLHIKVFYIIGNAIKISFTICDKNLNWCY